MTQLKLVETPTQTELLDNFIEVYNQTNERLTDTKNSLFIERTVTPDEKSFQQVKTALNAILNINLKKQRRSLELVKTQQEVCVVPETEEEETKLATLKSSLIFPGGMWDLDKTTLDRLFTDSSHFQNCVFAGVESAEVVGLDYLNNVVTSSCIRNSNDRDLHPRNSCLDGDEAWGLVSSLRTSVNHMYRPYSYSLEVDDYESALRVVNPLRGIWCEDTNSVVDYNGNPETYERVAECITSSLDELKTINERLDAYLEVVSISAKEFFSLLPDEVNTKLHEEMEIEKAKQLRASQVVRKTANVSLTFDLAVELDTLGDIDDIKEVISRKIQDQLSSPWGIKFDSQNFDCNYFRVEDTQFSGVNVVSVADEVVA